VLENGVLALSRQEVDSIIDRRGAYAGVTPSLSELMVASLRGGTSRTPRAAYSAVDRSTGILMVGAGRAVGAGATVRAYTAIPGKPPARPGWGVRLAFGEDLTLNAVVSEASIQEFRVGAGVGVVLKTLAPSSPAVAIIGSGKMARASAIAAIELCDPRSIVVCSPTAEHRDKLAAELSERSGITVTTADGVESAIQGADVIITSTSAGKRLLPDHVGDGVLVVSTGADELTADQVADDTFYVTGVSELSGTPEPLASLIEAGHGGKVLEFGDVLDGTQTRAEGRVWVMAMGTAIWDLAVTNWIVETAVADGIGSWVAGLE